MTYLIHICSLTGSRASYAKEVYCNIVLSFMYSNFLVSGMNSSESMRNEEEIPDKMITAEDLKGLPAEERE